MNTLLQKNSWRIVDSGRLTGQAHMDIDRESLAKMDSGQLVTPTLRIFEWSSPVVTYGYLLNRTKVEEWVQSLGHFPSVKRPTGGGAVLHQPSDLSFSLVWPRHQQILPEKPRDCYEAIHKALLIGLSEILKVGINLYTRSCASEPTSLPVPICFQEPVCNDIMLGGKKVIGGALRLTRKSILYQGNIQLEGLEKENLKGGLLKSFEPHPGESPPRRIRPLADRGPGFQLSV